MTRYETKGNPETEFQTGSKGKVLKNKLSIRSVHDIQEAESHELDRAMADSFKRFGPTHRFSEKDILHLHRSWLDAIYPWAGAYRSVNISKGGFLFPPPGRIPALMREFEKDVLAQHTPCRTNEPESIAEALAKVHAELILIHPFREGNGRLARLLSTLMALQAGCNLLNFSHFAGKKNHDYIVAIHQAMKRNYEPMTQLFLVLVRRSLMPER